MTNQIKDIVFSDPVIKFVTAANQYVTFAENATQFDRQSFLSEGLKHVSLLYAQALNLPELERINDEPNEKFVTEYDWAFVRNGIQALLDDDDLFIDNYDLEMNELPEPASYSISEFMADIYQDAKDFVEIYKLGDEILSNDAITDCYENFKNYWGIRATYVMKALHNLSYLKTDNNENKNKAKIKRNTDEWIISKAQRNFRNPK